MTRRPGQGTPRRRPRLHGASLALIATLCGPMGPARSDPVGGFNVVMTPDHPFGSTSAERALVSARRLGAGIAAIIPFLWQASPSSPDIQAGNDMSDDALRSAIRQARKAGFSVLVKPHVWVPESWAGAVEPQSEEAWRTWFARYRGQLERIARISAEEGADSLSIGTELAKTSRRPEWPDLVASLRPLFPGTLLYVAHNLEEAESVPFWPLLDAIGVSLYPPLGRDDDHVGRRGVMNGIGDRLEALSARLGKPIVVGEIGLRSARGAAAKPWESAEERGAAADPGLQADVIADWLAALNRPAIQSILIWRWFTDPLAGGPHDSDFTVQGKAAERVLACAWAGDCRKP